jgi:hypothetical protein
VLHAVVKSQSVDEFICDYNDIRGIRGREIVICFQS